MSGRGNALVWRVVCREVVRDCQIFCVRAVNGLPPGRPCFYQVGLINRSPYSIAN